MHTRANALDDCMLLSVLSLAFLQSELFSNRIKKFTMSFDGVRRKIHQDEYPGIVISFVNGLPGVLVGTPPAEDYSGGISIATLPGFGERLNKLRAKFPAGRFHLCRNSQSTT